MWVLVRIQQQHVVPVQGTRRKQGVVVGSTAVATHQRVHGYVLNVRTNENQAYIITILLLYLWYAVDWCFGG